MESVGARLGGYPMSKPANLRTAMPNVTAWIDGLRDAFGADDINAAIKSGMGGVPGFCAREAGHSVGTPPMQRGIEIPADQLVILRPKS